MSDYLETIKDNVRGMDFGTVVFFVRVHDGQVSTVDAQKLFTHKTKKGNEEVLQAVGALVKGMQAAGQSGSLTFTVDMLDGQSKKMVVQDMKRANFINKEAQQ